MYKMILSVFSIHLDKVYSQGIFLSGFHPISLFLFCTLLRLILNGEFFQDSSIKAGMPKGSILNSITSDITLMALC